MEDILYCKDLLDPIDGDSAKDWEMKNRKTIGYIRQWIYLSVFHHMSRVTDAKNLWKKLESLYKRKTTQNKAFAIRKLMNLKLKEGKSMSSI